MCSHGECHISDLGRAVCIREHLAADAALPVFDAAGSRAGRINTVVMLRRMRFLFNHASLGVITAGASVFLRAGRRAGGICYGFPFAECMICFGIFQVDGTTNTAFFPVLCIVMLADEGVGSRCTVFSLADITNSLTRAGSGSASMCGFIEFLFAGRTDMPVIRIIAVPAGCVGCMAGGRNHDAGRRDFILALGI